MDEYVRIRTEKDVSFFNAKVMFCDILSCKLVWVGLQFALRKGAL